jgi:hypothetical protein
MTEETLPPPPATSPSDPPLSGLRKWALVAEITAAAGVIVSLVFVGVQLMQANTLAREAAEQRQIEAIGNLSRILAENPFLSEAMAKAKAGETLTPGELAALTSLETYAQRTWEALYFQYRAGRVDPELWEAQRELARSIQSQPFSQAVWAQQKQWFSKSYRDFRDSDGAGKTPGSLDYGSPQPAPRPEPAAPQPQPGNAAPEAPKQ